MIVHPVLHDSLHSDKTGCILAFLSDFSTCALACFFFGSFSNTLADSRKDKLLIDTSAEPGLMGLGLRSGWTDMPATKRN